MDADTKADAPPPEPPPEPTGPGDAPDFTADDLGLADGAWDALDGEA